MERVRFWDQYYKISRPFLNSIKTQWHLWEVFQTKQFNKRHWYFAMSDKFFVTRLPLTSFCVLLWNKLLSIQLSVPFCYGSHISRLEDSEPALQLSPEQCEIDNLTLTGMSFEAANKQIAELLVLFATCFLIPISLLSLIRKIINCNILFCQKD